MNPAGKDQLTEFIALLNRYPSPHNGQPMMLEKHDDGTYEVYFDTSRGLSATPISYLFSFVTIGVFFRYVELCAQAAGYSIKIDAQLPRTQDMATPERLSCGSFSITDNANGPDKGLASALKFRRTSRMMYDSGLDDAEKDSLIMLGTADSVKLHFLNHKDAAKAVWLNQRAVFDDMFNKDVRLELRHWMRFDAKEKSEKKDGLAYDCMELSSGSLKFVFKHYKILHWPVIKGILRRYYLRTMEDKSTVGYLSAPFETEQHAYAIGRRVMDIWIELSKRGKYLHPFGTIVSNDLAHHDFAQLAGIENEERKSNYVTFIFRAGSSQPPVESERIDIKDHLFKGVTQ